MNAPVNLSSGKWRQHHHVAILQTFSHIWSDMLDSHPFVAREWITVTYILLSPFLIFTWWIYMSFIMKWWLWIWVNQDQTYRYTYLNEWMNHSLLRLLFSSKFLVRKQVLLETWRHGEGAAWICVGAIGSVGVSDIPYLACLHHCTQPSSNCYWP